MNAMIGKSGEKRERGQSARSRTLSKAHNCKNRKI